MAFRQPPSALCNHFGSLIFSLMLLISANGYSQFISRDVNNPSHYPEGTGYSGGIITYPVQYYQDTVEYTIPLIEELNNVETVDFDTAYRLYSCNGLKQTTTFDLNKDTGVIKIISRIHCSATDVVELHIIATYNGGAESDNQVFRVPFDRLPVKTVLFMNISGSMAQYTSNGETRWNVLKKSVDIFTILYEFFRQDDKDSIGLTYFTTNVRQPNPPLGDGFIGVTAWDADPLSAGTIRKDMNGRGSLYTTAIGKGLYNAKTKLKADAVNKFRKIAVLFTDGLQNVQPYVNVADGNTLADATTLNDSGTKTDSIRYFTIAGWLPGDTLPVLVKIAETSNGE